MKYRKGDRLKVSPDLHYCFPISEIWIYMEGNGDLHTLTNPVTNRKYDMFLTETLDGYFKHIPKSMVNK